MYRVHCILPRAEAERLSDILAALDPSPTSAVSVEEVSKTSWSLDAFCLDEASAHETAALIAAESPDARASVQKLDDKDWVAESLSGLPAVHAGPFVVAGAHELMKVRGGKIPVWIEAAAAFGTGHHGTTKGCLQALALELERKRPARVLDIGTGSGVLAIAAAKLGWDSVRAYDYEPASIEAAAANAETNDVTIELEQVNLRDGLPRLASTVVANLTAPTLKAVAVELAGDPGDTLICSGLLPTELDDVAAAFAPAGLAEADRRRDGDWAALLLRRS
jgi:ribosomal protein L11 methyltransferase